MKEILMWAGGLVGGFIFVKLAINYIAKPLAKKLVNYKSKLVLDSLNKIKDPVIKEEAKKIVASIETMILDSGYGKQKMEMAKAEILKISPDWFDPILEAFIETIVQEMKEKNAKKR